MGRILSALLIAVLMLSHGPMSAAVPHLDGSTHEHSHVVDTDHHDDHDADHADSDSQIAKVDTATNASDDLGKATHGFGYHTHVASDGVPSSGVTFASRRIAKDRLWPADDTRLRSTALEPLPEPPSA